MTGGQWAGGPDDPVRDYLAAISRIPLLTAQDETDLARSVEAGLYAERLLAAGGTRPSVESDGDLREIARQGRAAKQRMVEANLRLVVSVARRYAWSGMPLLDLAQEGNVGLIRAVEMFDHAQGFKFSTYATWWIRQAVSRSVANHSRLVRVPLHTAEKVERVRRAASTLENALGRDPTGPEIAAKAAVPAAEVGWLVLWGSEPARLDRPVSGEDGGDGLGDLLADPDAAAPFVRAEEDADALVRDAELAAVLDGLAPRDARVLRLRFGIGTAGGAPATLDDVGRIIGVGRERVRQIESRALAALRAEARADRLRSWIA